MAAVRSRGNRSTEVRLRARLVRAGVRQWKLNNRDVLGQPDFVFEEARVAVFVDGCFWHGCPRCCRMPAAHSVYWAGKIEGNRRRDRQVTQRLRRAGWRVVRVWEHEIKRSHNTVLERIVQAVGNAGRRSR
jgi:DNA mismatch endonuclease (patch repair protein)